MTLLNTLAFAAFVDELQSGVPIVGGPEVGEGLALGTGVGLFATLLAAPTALALLVEPAVLAWSDRADRRRVLVGAYLLMAALPLAAVGLEDARALAVAIGLWGAACGVATGVAQGAMAQTPDGPSVGLARWVRGAVLGDLAAPAVLALAAALGWGWRAALVVASVAPLCGALLTARVRLPPLVAEDEEDAPLREVIAAALRDPSLAAWSLAAASCTLLDELLVLLVALREHGEGGGASFAVMVLLAGSAVGGFAAEPLVRRFPARRVLVGGAVGAGVGLVGFVLWPAMAFPALVLLGAAAAPLYPLAQAEALARLPTRPGLVHAIQAPLAWVDVAAPLALGAIVASRGPAGALLTLLLQPLVVVAVAMATRRAGPAAVAPRSAPDPA